MDNTQVDFEKDDYRYMKQAITQAKKAYKLNEVPIGCVIVYEGKVIGRGYNRRNTDKTSLGHAEITAIKKASRYMGDWRLEDCTLYVQKCSQHFLRSCVKARKRILLSLLMENNYEI